MRTSLNKSSPPSNFTGHRGALKVTISIYNAGGLLDNIVNTLYTAVQTRADIMVITETKLAHGGVQMSSPKEWGFVQFADRGRTRTHAPSSGGVGVANLNHGLTITIIGHTVLGGLAVRITDRHGQYDPLYLVAVYVPPTSSTRADDREPLLDWAFSMYARLTAAGHHNIAIVGDFNTRPSGIRGHYSDDKSVSKTHTERTLGKRCRASRVTPIHGRTKRNPAPTTSRQITLRDGEGTAEVDYAFASTNSSFATPLQPPPWGPSGHGATHRAVVFRVSLLRAAGNTPAGARTARVQKHVPLRPQPYPDATTYNLVARSLRALAQRLPPDLATIQSALTATARQYMSVDPPRRVRTAVRNYKGFVLPSALVARIAATRHARRRLNASTDTASLTAQRAMLDEQLRLNRVTSRQVLRRRAASMSNRLDRIRGHDAHNLHRELNGMFTDDPTLVGREASDLPIDAARAHWADSLYDQREDLLPGATSPSALRHIPTATDSPETSGLAVPHGSPAPQNGPHDTVFITSSCVYNAIWGLSLRRPPTRCDNSASTQCPICDSVQRRWRTARHDRNAAVPTDGPHIHTSKGTGPDDVPAELLRFMRLSDDIRATDRLRLQLSKLIANALNLAIHTNSFPASFTITNLTALLKSAKVPHQDRSSANNYRPVVTSVYLDKVLDAILTRRLTHWAVRNKIIGNEQVGFMPTRSAEEHVATLRETLKARQRANLDTYILFLDLKKAYDRVHIRTLARVLEHMGVPTSITSLLVSLSTTRQTRIKMSGSFSDPFPATAGVPQGGIRSPILFDLFIESLSRYLKALPTYHGVDIAGINIRHLLYADDALALAVSVEQAQCVAFAVAHWCRLWGMEANIGGGKTELMHIPRPGALAAHLQAPPPRVWWPWEDSLNTIPWTSHYRYLGFPINTDLSKDAKTFTGSQRSQLKKSMYRFYSHNPLRKYMPLRSQKLILVNTITSSTTYLRGVVLRSMADCKSLDATALKLGRKLLGGPRPLPTTASNLIITLHSGIQLSYAQQAQMRERVAHTARLSTECILHQLLDGLAAGPRGPSNLVNTTRRQREMERTKLHVPYPPAPISPDAVQLWAHIYGIRVALGLQAVNVAHIPPAPFTDRPRCSSVQAAIVDAAGGELTQPRDVAITPHLPVSTLGPGTRGSLVLISDNAPRITTALVPNACGMLGTALPPWTATALPSDDDDTVDPVPIDRPPRSYTVFDRPCPICNTGHDDPYHAFFECPSARLRVARRRLFKGLKSAVRAVVRTGKLLAGRTLAPHRGRLTALEHANWDCADGRAATFRLLCGFPFSARRLSEHDAPLSHTLGTVFDALATDTRHLVPMARAITSWAAGCTLRAAAARRAAIDDCGAGVLRRPPRPPPNDLGYTHGAFISPASHDRATYTRWKLAHQPHCSQCANLLGSVSGCATCDLSIHTPGSRCSPRLRPMPVGSEWVCCACAVVLAPLAAALGDGAPTRLQRR